MDNIIYFMVPLVLIKTMLMMSLLPKKKYIFIFGGLCVLFIILMHPMAIAQNKLAVEEALTSREMLTNLSVIVMVDLMLSLGFSQSVLMKLSGRKLKIGNVILSYIPSVLIFPVLYYLHLNIFFLMPGNNFSLLTASFFLFSFILLVGGSLLFRKYLPETEFRTELTLLISFLLFLLTVCFTVFHPSAMIYTYSQPVDWKSLLLTTGVVVFLFMAGFIYKKWRDKRKRLREEHHIDLK